MYTVYMPYKDPNGEKAKANREKKRKLYHLNKKPLKYKSLKERVGELNPFFGKKHSAETLKRMRTIKKGENNPNWKGDKVGYDGVHAHIKTVLKKTKVCNECKLKKPLDLANKGVYNRNVVNWEWLCRRCHMLKDGRLEAFKLNRKRRK